MQDSSKDSGTTDIGSGSFSGKRDPALNSEPEYCSLETDSDTEMLHSIVDITGSNAERGEASYGTVGKPSTSKPIGDSSLTPYQNMAKAGRIVPPRASVPDLSDNDDAFMPEVQAKPVPKPKDRGVVRKAVGHDNPDHVLQEHAIPLPVFDKRQTRGSSCLLKLANIPDDFQDPEITAKLPGTARGSGRGGGRGASRSARNSKIVAKKQKLSK
jgi:hypothetical protein